MLAHMYATFKISKCECELPTFEALENCKSLHNAHELTRPLTGSRRQALACAYAAHGQVAYLVFLVENDLCGSSTMELSSYATSCVDSMGLLRPECAGPRSREHVDTFRYLIDVAIPMAAQREDPGAWHTIVQFYATELELDLRAYLYEDRERDECIQILHDRKWERSSPQLGALPCQDDFIDAIDPNDPDDSVEPSE